MQRVVSVAVALVSGLTLAAQSVRFTTDQRGDFVIIVWLLGLLGLLAARLVRRRRGAAALMGVAVVSAALVSRPARAQAVNGLDLQRYRPGPGINDVLSVSSARTGGHLGLHLGGGEHFAPGQGFQRARDGGERRPGRQRLAMRVAGFGGLLDGQRMAQRARPGHHRVKHRNGIKSASMP